MEFLLYILFGISAGILSGLFGIGGGIVMVPALILFFGLDIFNANATSLAAMLLPVGIFGVIAYYKAGLVHIKESLWIAAGLFAGSFAGAELAVNLSEKILTISYAAFLLYIAFVYFEIYEWLRAKFSKQIQKNETQKPYRKRIVSFVMIGLAAGVFAGMFGKGGGIIIVPLLIGLFNYEGKKAVATSLAALQLPVGLPSVIIYAQAGYFNLTYAALIAMGIVAGSLAGSYIGIKLHDKTFKKLFALFLIIMSVYMLTGYSLDTK